MAFQRGEDTEAAILGALMHAQYQATVVNFIKAYVAAMTKAGKK